MEIVWAESVARIGLRRVVQVGDRFFLELNNRAHRRYHIEVSIETARRYCAALSKEVNGKVPEVHDRTSV